MRLTSRSISIFAFAFLAGCLGRPNEPRPGVYRAVVELPGGHELPLQLEVEGQGKALQLWVVAGDDKRAATGVKAQDGSLTAQLPNGLGMLSASVRRKGLTGQLELTDNQGGRQTLSLEAEHGAAYRFFDKSATDNADVSGRWTFECEGKTRGFTAELRQSHDNVDGVASPAGGADVTVWGQVRNDEVLLGGWGNGRTLLYKAHLNKRGQLEGKFWEAAQKEQACSGMRLRPEVDAEA